MQKMCQSQQLSHGIVAAVFMGSKLLSPFCHPGSNFRGKSKTRGSSTIFFSLELELGTYINLYSFESSIERPFRDIFFLQTQQNPRFAKVSSQTRTSKRYNTLGSIAITHRQKYNLFLNNPASFC